MKELWDKHRIEGRNEGEKIKEPHTVQEGQT
jgi:hypothetical protein